MLRDPQLLHTAQIALIGIVLVGGLFYLWRILARIEDKLDAALRMPPAVLPPTQAPAHTCGFAEEYYDEEPVCEGEPCSMADAESMMREIFGGADAPIFMVATSPPPAAPTPSPKVTIEEIPQDLAEPVADIEPEPSEAGTTTGNPLSRNKLKKSTIFALQQIARERGLPDDGTKAQLIERILASE